MPLASIHLLPAVVAMRAPLFGRLDRLAVNDGRAGSQLASDRATHALTQDTVNALPDARPSPRIEVVVHGGPRPVLPRQIAPSAPRTQQIEDAVEDSTQVDTTGTPTRLCCREQGFEHGPFAS